MRRLIRCVKSKMASYYCLFTHAQSSETEFRWLEKSHFRHFRSGDFHHQRVFGCVCSQFLLSILKSSIVTVTWPNSHDIVLITSYGLTGWREVYFWVPPTHTHSRHDSPKMFRFNRLRQLMKRYFIQLSNSRVVASLWKVEGMSIKASPFF